MTSGLRYNNYDYVLKTNSLGLPGPEVSSKKRRADSLRVLVIGDAFTMPEAIEWQNAYPALLQKSLSDQLAPRQVEVINGGVTGYGPVESLPQLQELAPQLRPDIVIYQFFVNEFHEIHLSREKRLQSIGFVPRTPSRVRKIMDGLQLWHRCICLKDFVEETVYQRPAMRKISKSFLPLYARGPNDIYDERSMAKLRSHLDRMKRAADAVGARFVVLYVPSAVAVSKPHHIAYLPRHVEVADYDLDRPFKELLPLSHQLAIPLIDPSDALRSHNSQPSLLFSFLALEPRRPSCRCRSVGITSNLTRLAGEIREMSGRSGQVADSHGGDDARGSYFENDRHSLH